MIDHSEFYKQIGETIAEHGRQVIAVGGDRKHKPFFYTIGNHDKGLPELLLIGPFRPDMIMNVLNELSEKTILTGKPFFDGEQANLGGSMDVTVYDTTIIAQLEYTMQATAYYGHKAYRVQQVLLPDPQGRYPTEKVCHKHYRVPVLRPVSTLMQSVRLH